MEKKLDLLLVNPSAREQVYHTLGKSLSGIEPPIWSGLIASFIRERGHSVKIIDAEAENWAPSETADKIVQYDPLLAGIIVLGSNPSASSTPKMPAVHNMLVALKEKKSGIETVLAGLHPSALPEKTLREENTDYVCKGEGFYTFSKLLDVMKSGKDPKASKIEGLWYIKDNKVVSNQSAPLIKNLNELPFTAWDLLPMDKYRAHNWHCFDNLDKREPYAALYTSMGCPFSCSYCNIHALYGDKLGIRLRSPANVVEEIELLVRDYKVRNIKFIDELFAIKESRVNELCDLIIEKRYDLNIWAYARVDTVSENMLKKMKKAGVHWLAYGFESANKDVRKGVAKQFGQDVVDRAVQITQDNGINIIGNFIFGLPDDNFETMQETLDMASKYNFEYANFYTAMAYPGSRLYEECLQNGVELPKTWRGYSQYGEDTTPLPTKYLSAADVLRFRDDAFRKYFSNPAYISKINDKFGPKVVQHIKNMLSHDVKRNLLKDNV